MKRLFAVAAAMAAMSAAYANDLEEIREAVSKEHKVLAVDAFHGFNRVIFDFKGHKAWICSPSREPLKGKPWTWTMQWATAYVPRTNVLQMLRGGYHHVTIETFERRMDEKGLEVSADFQRFLVERLGFAPKAYLVGMSWGGFFSVRYAANYPGNVAKIYLDAPLLVFDGFKGDIKVVKRGMYGHHPHGVEVDETTIKDFFEAK